MLNAEGNMRSEDREALRKYLNQRYGLDRPLYVQYGKWLNQVLPIGFEQNPDGTLGSFGFKAPDLGESRSRSRKVIDIVAEALPVTLMLNLISVPIIYAIAVSTGILAGAMPAAALTSARASSSSRSGRCRRSG